MLLNEMNLGKARTAQRALSEQFEVKLDLDKLDRSNCEYMLARVQRMLAESRRTQTAHSRENSGSYLKLVMMEQALTAHLLDIRRGHRPARIVVESEEVEKSQVILAAQDMVDSIQKMIEQVSKMTAEELPAVVTGIENEIGVDQSGQFESSAQEALTTLQQALVTAKGSMKTAMAAVTGEAAPAEPEAFAAEPAAEPEAEAEPAAELPELPELPEVPAEQPEEQPVAGVGRARR